MPLYVDDFSSEEDDDVGEALGALQGVRTDYMIALGAADQPAVYRAVRRAAAARRLTVEKGEPDERPS